MGKRRTNIEICIQLRKDRDKLYRQRAKLINEQKLGKLSTKQTDKSNDRIKRLSSRIDSYKSKLFKCGKKYAGLKKKRKSLINKVNRIKRLLKSDRTISKSERNKMLSEILLLNSDIRDLSKVMQMEIYEQGKGKLFYVSDISLLESTEMTVIWDAKSKIEGLIRNNEFDTLIIGTEPYNLIIDRLSALFAVDDYIAEIVASQRDSLVKTPMVEISLSLITKTVTIK